MLLPNGQLAPSTKLGLYILVGSCFSNPYVALCEMQRARNVSLSTLTPTLEWSFPYRASINDSSSLSTAMEISKARLEVFRSEKSMPLKNRHKIMEKQHGTAPLDGQTPSKPL